MIQGQADRCTPAGQGEELFGAIALTGTECELVVYPREGHVPVERAHLLDALQRTQAWFDRHKPAGLSSAGRDAVRRPSIVRAVISSRRPMAPAHHADAHGRTVP